MISITSYLGYLEKLKLHYLEISGEDLAALNNGEEQGKFNQRVVISFPNSLSWQGGVVALGEGKGYITISKARMKTLDLHEGDKVSFSLTKDTNEYGHELPIEFQEVLIQDPEARERFHAMAPGKQRTVIYYINQVKNSDKRIERSLEYMENLKKCPPGKETMRGIFGKE
jgi:hypothetical protein